MDDKQIIHYVKPDEIYGVYGTITLIFLVLLIWYFVRSNMFEEGMITLENHSVLAMMPEWRNKADATGGNDGAIINVSLDDNSPIYNTKNNYCGSYGGVPVCVYDVANGKHNPEWDHDRAIYLPNSRTLFRQALEESIEWK